jgi:hypothetical protein
MDTSKPMKESAHLLDDLESIRQLLGDDSLQPPLLTDTVSRENQIPLLFDVVGAKASESPDFDTDETDIPTLTPQASAPAPEPVQPAEPAPPAPVTPNPDTLLHLDSELRAAAQLIMQDVIDDFAPHIETEIRRRMDARMERLLSQYED